MMFVYSGRGPGGFGSGFSNGGGKNMSISFLLKKLCNVNLLSF